MKEPDCCSDARVADIKRYLSAAADAVSKAEESMTMVVHALSECEEWDHHADTAQAVVTQMGRVSFHEIGMALRKQGLINRRWYEDKIVPMPPEE